MFPSQGFTEIVFCAVTSNEQVKVIITLHYSLLNTFEFHSPLHILWILLVTLDILSYQTEVGFERYSDFEYTMENLNQRADLESLQ